jgi:ribonuclease HI
MKTPKNILCIRTLHDLHDHSNGWIGFFDGASNPNPGQMGLGALLKYQGQVIDSISMPRIGLGTNNRAEYLSLIELLKLSVRHSVDRMVICGDSKLVVSSMSYAWKLKNHQLRLLIKEARDLSDQIKYIRWAWIPRELNTTADALSKGHYSRRPRKRKTNMTPRLIKSPTP